MVDRLLLMIADVFEYLMELQPSQVITKVITKIDFYGHCESHTSSSGRFDAIFVLSTINTHLKTSLTYCAFEDRIPVTQH